jgi:hypothetical protein
MLAGNTGTTYIVDHGKILVGTAIVASDVHTMLMKDRLENLCDRVEVQVQIFADLYQDGELGDVLASIELLEHG